MDKIKCHPKYKIYFCMHTEKTAKLLNKKLRYVVNKLKMENRKFATEI